MTAVDQATDPGYSLSKSQSKTGSADQRSEPRFLIVGQISRPHGVRGEVAVSIMTEFPERFDAMETIYVGNEDAIELPIEHLQRYEVTSTRWHGDRALVQFADINDRNTAEKLRGLFLLVPIEEAILLEDDAYYVYQLVGLTVITDTSEVLGTLVEVIETGANDVYLVQGPKGELLLPAINEVILEVDLQAGNMVVHLIDGLGE